MGLTALASDTALYEITKGLRYTQSTAGLVLLTNNGYPFDVKVYPTTQGYVTNAFVKVPGSNGWTQLVLNSTDSHYEFSPAKNTLKVLNKDFPDGTYSLEIFGVHDGEKMPTLVLQGDTYPTAPQIANLAALQAVNANGYGLVSWNAAGYGYAPNFVRLTIEDASGNQVWQSPDLDQPGPWNVVVTNALLNAGTFATGQAYLVRLLFQTNTVLDRTTYPGAIGAAGYLEETRCALTTTTALAPDVKEVEVAKGTEWAQTNSGPPVPDPAGQYAFNASAKSYLANVLSTGTVTLPLASNNTRSLTLQADQQTLSYQDELTSAATLDATYGNGNFTVNFTAPHDGAKALTLPLQSVTNAPQTPRLTNFSALQAIVASQPTVVAWFPWTNGTAEDFVRLHIEDLHGNVVFDTPNLGAPKALNGGVTNATIPAGTLPPGQSCSASLTFQRTASFNITNYPAVLAIADYYARSKFTLVTLPADVASYSVVKGQLFSQSGAAAPVALSTNGYTFSAQAVSSASGTVTNGSTVVTPLAATKSLTLQPDGLTWAFNAVFASESALDTAFPFGAYTMNLNCAHDGVQTLALPLTTASYPNAPQVANLAAAQAFNPAQPFTLSWISFLNPGANGFIQLAIFNTNGAMVFSTPALGAAGALSGFSTSAVIPAGTLTTNRPYQATLMFERFEDFDTVSYPGATGIAAVTATTQFAIGTSGITTPPVFATVGLSNGLFQLSAQVISQQTYRLDGSPTLPAVWTPLLTNTPAGNIWSWVDPNSAGRRQYFYRLVLLP